MKRPLEFCATEARFTNAMNRAVCTSLQLETDQSFRVLENASYITNANFKHHMDFWLLMSAMDDYNPAVTLRAELAVSIRTAASCNSDL